MNSINRHIEGIDPVEFFTTVELMEMKFVEKMKNMVGFSKFSVDHRHKNLVCETIDGKWYIVGELKHTHRINLPKWERPTYSFR